MDKIKRESLSEIWDDDYYTVIKNGMKYWTNAMDGYNCHIFTCELSVDQITEFWNNIVSLIATNFQASLKLEVERWNIYLIFLTTDKGSKEMKYRIEQDKYCCRKLVEDGLKADSLTDKGIIDLLEKILFTIEVGAVATSRSEESSAAIIQKRSTGIFNALEDFEFNKHIAPFYDKLLKSQA
jgi:hypothetical protein